MTRPVLTKADMYERLKAGEFGNTNPSYESWNKWGEYAAQPGLLWGLRHRTIGAFPGTRLNVPTEEVFDHLRTAFGFANYNISPMVPGRRLWEGDVTDLYACGNVDPVSGSWRRAMLTPTQWRVTQYRAFFRQHMTPDSYDDLMILLDKYPDHVVELSLLDQCFGTVPGRNAVIWEVRKY